jgi:GT2 family glycosyltransferase
VSAVEPVSAVVPCLDDRDLLAQHLPPLLAEFERRAVGDQAWVVDDTGGGVLAPWLAREFAPALGRGALHCLSRAENGGFARALLDGARAAPHEVLFAMNPDIRVHAGFLEPLTAALADPRVHSVVPKILLFGRAEQVESLTEIEHERDVAYVRQRGLEGRAEPATEHSVPVNYAIGGAMLLRRSEFLAQGGFDPLYEPFYYEDVDLGFAAWRAGRRVLYEPASVVEHHHRGTIRKRVQGELVRAVIERNRYLFQWRFLDGEERLRRHLAALYRTAVDAHLRDEREELVWLLLALERLDELEAARARLGPARRSYDEVCAQSRPAAAD